MATPERNPFPKIRKKCKVDLLIDLDCVELQISLGESHGEKGEPVARLTPLGWTCVGPVETGEMSMFTFHSVKDLKQMLLMEVGK